jgi:transposase
MDDRRLVGIDLGITSAHTVRVLAGDGSLVCRRKAIPTVDSLGEVERAALAGTPMGTLLEVVVEPTGPAWLPIAVFFAARGHTVYRVSSAKAHDLRRVLSRHAKSNSIDADTLARLPLVDPAGLHPLQLPDAARAALDRRVRACDRLTRQAATHKRRIKDLVHQLLPASPLTGELGQADLAVLERWADPHALLAAGRARLQRVLATASAGQQGAQRAQQWLAAARAALQLYGDHPAIAFTELAAEVTSEVRLLRATQAELADHASNRERCYRRVDPAGLARSLPGLATIGGPALAATMGTASRFANASKFRCFTGLAPKASETGQTDRKGQPSARPATGCCGPPWSAPPTTPAAKTPSWPASTTPRWSSAARTTSARSAWSPPTWPSAPGRSWTAARRMWSATPMAPRSPPPKPSPSSPTTGRSPTRSASGGAARRGRPLSKSCKDMPTALKAQRGDPPPPRPLLANSPAASSRPNLQP